MAGTVQRFRWGLCDFFGAHLRSDAHATRKARRPNIPSPIRALAVPGESKIRPLISSELTAFLHREP